jgi:hypothetical protein
MSGFLESCSLITVAGPLGTFTPFPVTLFVSKKAPSNYDNIRLLV